MPRDGGECRVERGQKRAGRDAAYESPAGCPRASIGRGLGVRLLDPVRRFWALPTEKPPYFLFELVNARNAHHPCRRSHSAPRSRAGCRSRRSPGSPWRHRSVPEARASCPMPHRARRRSRATWRRLAFRPPLGAQTTCRDRESAGARSAHRSRRARGRCTSSRGANACEAESPKLHW